MRLFIRSGNYRLGLARFDDNSTGVVIGFPKIVMDVGGNGSRRFNEATVSTQWSCGVNKLTGKMELVNLEIFWVDLKERVDIPFDPTVKTVRSLLRRICRDKKVYLINPEYPHQMHGTTGGIYSDITRTQVTEWLDMEDAGKSVSNWSEYDSISYDIGKGVGNGLKHHDGQEDDSRPR